MVLMGTENTQYYINNFFGEIIYKFQDCNKKYNDYWKEKSKISKQSNL